MNNNLTHLTTSLICLPMIILCLLTCALPQDQTPVIHELLYPTEVPACFDTALTCRVADPANDKLRFQWSSENGTIKGDGESITWTAPGVPGTYKIGLKVDNTGSMETLSMASVNVVPFYKMEIDPVPLINLKLPVFGNALVSEQSLVRPATTAEINFEAPFLNMKNYKYLWSCNGGKLQGIGIKDGTASKAGWIAPGVPGYYTVVAKISDSWGNMTIGLVYFHVKIPACCELR